jgi:hypothetical protein
MQPDEWTVALDTAAPIMAQARTHDAAAAFYEVSADTATITFSATTNAQGQETKTSVTVKRPSGIDEMLPK